MNNGSAAVYRKVGEISPDRTLVGKRVKVGGTVVAGSWNGSSNPMVFRIRDEGSSIAGGPELLVSYSGAAPSTFGSDVVAIVTGTLGSDGTVRATEMITKCPSKYESAGASTQPAVPGK